MGDQQGTRELAYQGQEEVPGESGVMTMSWNLLG